MSRVATSSLLQIPLALQLLGQDQSVAVLTADATTLSPLHLTAAGVTKDQLERVHLTGLEKTPHFSEVINGRQPALDTRRAEDEVLATVRQALLRWPDIGAFVLECTNLPPYAAAIRTTTGLPVWDALSPIDWLHAGTCAPLDLQ